MIEITPNWHPIFVHFTVALFSVATGVYVLSLLIPDGSLKEQWRTVARWNLWFGMGVTVITVLSGWYAYNTVLHDAPSHLAMSNHRNWAIATAILFAMATLWSVLRYRTGKEASSLLITLLVVASATLSTTAWRGGEVVYRYGLGVMSLPNAGSHGHVTGETGDGHGNDDVVHEHHGQEGERPDESPKVLTEEKQSSSKVVPHDDHEGSDVHSH